MVGSVESKEIVIKRLCTVMFVLPWFGVGRVAESRDESSRLVFAPAGATREDVGHDRGDAGCEGSPDEPECVSVIDGDA